MEQQVKYSSEFLRILHDYHLDSCEQSFQENNIFAEVCSTKESGDDIGPEINGVFANLLTKVMMEKRKPFCNKRQRSIISSKKCECTKYPRTNKSIWEAMGGPLRSAGARLE